MALTNPCFKDQFGLKLGRTRREERRGEEEEEEEGEKRKEEKPKVWNFGFLVWKLTLYMNPMRLSMNFHALMLRCLSPNLGF